MRHAGVHEVDRQGGSVQGRNGMAYLRLVIPPEQLGGRLPVGHAGCLATDGIYRGTMGPDSTPVPSLQKG